MVVAPLDEGNPAAARGKQCTPKSNGKLMIRPLRQGHRRIFAMLAIILPATFAIGVAARKPVPTVEGLPAALMPSATSFPATVWSRNDLFSKAPIPVSLLRERADTGRYAIQLFVPAAFAKPDVLIYWRPVANISKDSIPDDAVFVGPLSGSTPRPLPGEISSAPGSLILYSLANGEVVDVSKPFSP